MDPGDCGGSLAAVHAAAASNTSDLTEMKRVVRLAFGGWSRRSHWLHKDAVRKAAATTLLVAYRLDVAAVPGGQVGAAAAADAAGGRHPEDGARAPLSVLPPEIWETILGFLARRHW